ncbi:transcription antitermination factor NusB [Geoalkalibacter ferrihydriticus]|uniref:transcription antitermination factor NusB n=1 Tax=Geoalkalibacter ferrihydriticus TaxID=392333 RepID=UPI0006944C8D|nr:transcription antitermination factor NusB [Geoalkalibacter ferrihydriticus]
MKSTGLKAAQTSGRDTTGRRGARRQARELALKVIYSLRDQEPDIRLVLDRFWGNFRFSEDVLGDPLEDVSQKMSPDVLSFAETLVRGVHANLEAIDRVLKEYSTNWTLGRMARVDLAILRLAAYELLYCPSVPNSVIINEAIEIGKRFGSQETPSFVNGILDQISRKYGQ